MFNSPRGCSTLSCLYNCLAIHTPPVCIPTMAVSFDGSSLGNYDGREPGLQDDLGSYCIHFFLAFMMARKPRLCLTRGETLIDGVHGEIIIAPELASKAMDRGGKLVLCAIHIDGQADYQGIGLPPLDQGAHGGPVRLISPHKDDP